MKKIKGRKRFIATDVCVNIIERRVVSASMREEAGGEVLIGVCGEGIQGAGSTRRDG